MTARIRIAMIDDDEAVLDSLQTYLHRNEIDALTFTAANGFLTALEREEQFECVVSDVCMPGMSGLDLVGHLKSAQSRTPIILITGHGDIDMAVAAIKIGAFDFIEKPFNESRLLASIHMALEKSAHGAVEAAKMEELKSRVESLSLRQRQVMELAANGFSNKEIASELNISPKTVQNHRAWVMERIGARNVAELVRIAMQVQAKN